MTWRNFEIGDACIYNSNIYFFENYTQTIMSMDLYSFNLEIKKKYFGIHFLSVKSYLLNDIIYFFSGNSLHVISYNVKKNEYKDIKFKHNKKNINTIMCINKKAWFIPFELKEKVILFDMEKKEFIIDDNYSNIFTGYEKYKCNYPTFDKTVIWHAILGTNKIIGYDIETKEISEKIFSKEIKINTAYVFENNVYISEINNGNIVVIDLDKSKENIIKTKGLQRKTYSFIYKHDNSLYFLPRHGDSIAIINVENKKNINRKNIYIAKNQNQKSASIGCVFTEDKIIILPWGYTDIYVINKQSSKSKKLEIKIEQDEVFKYIKYNKNIIIEDKNISINKFSDFIIERIGLNRETIYDREKTTAGKNIWEITKNI